MAGSGTRWGVDGRGLMTTVIKSQSRRRADLHVLIPLVVDVVLPAGTYYLLHVLGVGDAPALILSGSIPFGRSLYGLVVSGKADYLALMMVGLFILSLVLVAFTGSPRFILVKESFGTALIGLWCVGSAWSTRPLTFYTARPILTKGCPEALASWDRLAASSTAFQSIQRRLAIFWAVGLFIDAAVRVWIAVHLPVHVAVWLVNVPAVCIVVALCMMTGPLGALRLQRLLVTDIASMSASESPAYGTPRADNDSSACCSS
jgi:hypothetical protein